jgi:hypothetical protein
MQTETWESVNLEKSSGITLHCSVSPRGYAGKIVCTYDGNLIIISREWQEHRTPIRRFRFSGASEIYFLGPDLVVSSDDNSFIALKSCGYEFYTDSRIVSPGDQITALATYGKQIIAVGFVALYYSLRALIMNRYRSGQVRIFGRSSEACGFDQFIGAIEILRWGQHDRLELVTLYGQVWEWSRASSFNVYPHLLKLSGFTSDLCGRPKPSPGLVRAQRRQFRRAMLLQKLEESLKVYEGHAHRLSLNSS